MLTVRGHPGGQHAFMVNMYSTKTNIIKKRSIEYSRFFHIRITSLPGE